MEINKGLNDWRLDMVEENESTYEKLNLKFKDETGKYF